MKKLSIFALAALTLLSCSKYKAQEIELVDTIDSINYALGYTNGEQIRKMGVEDSTKVDVAVKEFIDALQKGWETEVEEEPSMAANIGKQIANDIKQQEEMGLVAINAWTLNEKIYLQAFVNGLYNEASVMEDADLYAQTEYSKGQQQDGIHGDAIKGKCPKSAKVITLSSYEDSVNYAFGYVSGARIGAMYLGPDADEEDKQELIATINKSLKENYEFPQLVSMGENVGKAIKAQVEEGLVGINGLETRFEVIKQGFINGMYLQGWSSAEAQQYLQESLPAFQKKEGEEFLTENAKRENVKVTESGLQYEVIEEPNPEGIHPTAEDTVYVHYEGKLIDGTEFDSSYKRGEPISFPLNGVIRGWTEGLQLMTIGSKYMLYIPYNLGYGEHGAGAQIKPYSTLIFTVELLDIKHPAPAKKAKK